MTNPCPLYSCAGVLVLICLACSGRGSGQSLNGYAPLSRDSEIDFKYAVRIGGDGVFEVVVDALTRLRLFGEDFSDAVFVDIVTSNASCESGTGVLKYGMGNVTMDDPECRHPCTSNTGTVELTPPKFDAGKHGRLFYFCLDGVHQGDQTWNTVRIVNPQTDPIPLAVRILMITVLLMLSGTFSGLNLGLMALDVNSLKIIMESGTKKQQGYAKVIYPVRRRGNYLLCTLLLGNVMVNSAFSILLGDLTNGYIAIIGSTLFIVIFGEIIPQAVCSRYGLLVGAKTIYLTYFFMALTFPVSFPLSLILDWILGEELGAVYNRDQLLLLLQVTKDRTDLENDEVNIMTGALEFKKKHVSDVMTNISDVFCLEITSFLDFKTIKQIYESGYSRVPVYEGDKDHMVGVLFLRDLAFIDPEDGISLLSVMNFHKRELYSVFVDKKLDDTLNDFVSGKSHLAIVYDIITETEGDPYYKVVGVVTLEDILEEILQTEICDETDRFVDNRSLKPRNLKNLDIGGLVGTSAGILTPHQSLAITQFLSSSVEPFNEEHISSNTLKKLLQQDIVVKKTYDASHPQYIYTIGKPANSFVLVIEGTVQVEVGNDKLQFQTRSFSHFGSQALMQVVNGGPLEYTPDFSVEIVSDSQLLVVTQMQYRAAYRATKFERDGSVLTATGQHHSTSSDSETDPFKSEWLRIQTSLSERVSMPGRKARSKKPRHTKSGSGSSEEMEMLLTSDNENDEFTELSYSPPIVDGIKSGEEVSLRSFAGSMSIDTNVSTKL